jgi:hypothetical protein
MFYQLYKYLFLWQFEQPPSSDTGGLFFPKAISQLFVGLYISEVNIIHSPHVSRDFNYSLCSCADMSCRVVLPCTQRQAKAVVRPAGHPHAYSDWVYCKLSYSALERKLTSM